MKVAVLGASGNAGAEITRELARRGHAVTAIARNTDAVPTARTSRPPRATPPIPPLWRR